MSVIPGQDLISLGSLFASNLDDAAFVARRSETDVRLAALRRERETLESSARRRHEVEVHVDRMRRLSLEQRLNSLQSGALRPPDSAPAAPSRSSFLEHPHSAAAQLEAARQRFSDRVRAEYPAWSVARQAVQVEAAAVVRDELLQVEKRRAVANEGFQAEMTVEAALARERQRVQLARALEREEARAHEQLRKTLLGTGGGAAAAPAPPATSALPSNATEWAGALPAMLAAAAASWPTSQPTSQTVRPTGPLASTAPVTAPVALPAAPPLAAPGAAAAAAAAAAGVMPMAPVAAIAQAARAQAARDPTAGRTAAAAAAVPPPAADAASPDTLDDAYDVSALRRAVGVAPALMADAATDMTPAGASFVPIGDEEADGDFGEGGPRYGAASGASGGAATPYASSHGTMPEQQRLTIEQTGGTCNVYLGSDAAAAAAGGGGAAEGGANPARPQAMAAAMPPGWAAMMPPYMAMFGACGGAGAATSEVPLPLQQLVQLQMLQVLTQLLPPAPPVRAAATYSAVPPLPSEADEESDLAGDLAGDLGGDLGATGAPVPLARGAAYRQKAPGQVAVPIRSDGSVAPVSAGAAPTRLPSVPSPEPPPVAILAMPPAPSTPPPLSSLGAGALGGGALATPPGGGGGGTLGSGARASASRSPASRSRPRSPLSTSFASPLATEESMEADQLEAMMWQGSADRSASRVAANTAAAAAAANTAAAAAATAANTAAAAAATAAAAPAAARPPAAAASRPSLSLSAASRPALSGAPPPATAPPPAFAPPPAAAPPAPVVAPPNAPPAGSSATHPTRPDADGAELLPLAAALQAQAATLLSRPESVARRETELVVQSWRTASQVPLIATDCH